MAVKRALLLMGLVACGSPPAPTAAPSSTATPVASASATAEPRVELPPGPNWPRDQAAPYALIDGPLPDLQALVPHPEVKTDPDGVTLPNGVRRRFGGSRYRAPVGAKVFFDGNEIYAVESQWRLPFRLHDLASGKVKWEQASGESLYLAQAGHVALGYRNPTVVVAKTGQRIGPRKGLGAPYAWAMNGLVALEKRRIVHWVPGGRSRTLYQLGPKDRLGELVSNGTSVVAGFLRQYVQGQRGTEQLFVLDVRTGRHRKVDLGKRGDEHELAVADDGTVLFTKGHAVLRVVATNNKGPEELISASEHITHLVAGKGLGAYLQRNGVFLDVVEEVHVFDLKSGATLATIQAPGEVTQILLSPSDTSLVVVDKRGEVRRYDPQSGDERSRTPGHAWTRAAHLSASGSRLLTAGSRLDLWDAAANRHLRGRDLEQSLVAARLVDDTTAVTLSEGGRAQWWSLDRMLSSEVFDDERDHGRHHEVRWDVDVHAGRVAIEREKQVVVFGADRTRAFTVDGAARGLHFGPRGELAVASRGHLTIYDQNGQVAWRKPFPFDVEDGPNRSKARAVVAFSPSGRRIAVGQPSGVLVIDLPSGEVVRGLDVGPGPLAFENETILLTGQGERLGRWSVEGSTSGQSPELGAALEAIQAHRHGVLVTLESGATTLLARDALPKLETHTLSEKTPDLVATLSGARHLSLGHTYRYPALCVAHDGATSCWGTDDHGITGFGGKGYRDAPTVLPDAPDVPALGSAMGCGVASGEWRCWGRVEPSTGLRSQRAMVPPTAIEGLDQPVRAGDVRGERWCIADRDGDVVCVEHDEHGPFRNVSAKRGQVIGLKGARAVAVGERHACAITGDAAGGEVWCWGSRNRNGQLGFGRATNAAPAHATRVTGIDDATALVAGRNHTCALRATGTVVCWGLGLAGQLGDGTQASRARPVEVKGLANVVSLFTSDDATYAVTRAGKLYGWGHLRPWGTTVPAPNLLSGFTDVVAGTADLHGLCVADTSGAIRCVERHFTSSKKKP